MKNLIFKTLAGLALSEIVLFLQKKIKNRSTYKSLPNNEHGYDVVDLASAESFPASDPPSWIAR